MDTAVLQLRCNLSSERTPTWILTNSNALQLTTAKTKLCRLSTDLTSDKVYMRLTFLFAALNYILVVLITERS